MEKKGKESLPHNLVVKHSNQTSMSQAKDTTQALNLRRAYTTGGKLGARQMFVFNEDGTIAGLKTVKPVE